MAKNVKDLYVVEAVFRVRIDYDVGMDDDSECDRLEAVSRKAFEWERKYNVNIDSMRGGPCWNAYFIIEGDSEKNVRKVAEMIIRLVLRYKGGRTL